MAEPKEAFKRSYDAESANEQMPRLVPASSTSPEAGDRHESNRDSRSTKIDGELVQRVIDHLKGL